MTTYFHVAPADHTGDLESLAEQFGESEAIEMYTTRWPEAGQLALNGHASMIHLYDTIEEARSHKETYGGKIYAVDGEAMEDDFLKVERMIDARTHHDPAKAPGLITEALAITGKQTELAARLGVTPKYLQFLKSGRSTNMSYLLQVALERLIAEHQDSA